MLVLRVHWVSIWRRFCGYRHKLESSHLRGGGGQVVALQIRTTTSIVIFPAGLKFHGCTRWILAKWWLNVTSASRQWVARSHWSHIRPRGFPVWIVNASWFIHAPLHVSTIAGVHGVHSVHWVHRIHGAHRLLSSVGHLTHDSVSSWRWHWGIVRILRSAIRLLWPRPVRILRHLGLGAIWIICSAPGLWRWWLEQ
jgi:hypothetical protein